MRQVLTCCFVVGCVLFYGISPLPVAADQLESQPDLSFASYNERLAAMEAELASLRGETYDETSPVQNDCVKCGGGKSCSCGPTWIVGAEMYWFQVYNSPVPGLTPKFGQDPTIRVWGERQLWDGVGFRATYWDADDQAFGALLGGTVGEGIDLFTFDLEATHRHSAGCWDITFSGGARVGGLEQSLTLAGGGGAVGLLRDFDGAGLTFSAGFQRPLYSSNLSLYSNLRGSLLFGDTDIGLNVAIPGVPIGPIPVATIANQTVAIWEINLGVQYDRETDYGLMFARLGVEAQLWEVPPVLLGLGDDNVGMFGPTVALGFQR